MATKKTKKSKKKITEGTIVRYAPEWCAPGERYYLHVCIEKRLNPVTMKMSRWLIQTINMKNMHFQPTSEVEDYMIESTGYNIKDYLNGVIPESELTGENN